MTVVAGLEEVEKVAVAEGGVAAEETVGMPGR